MWNPIDLLVLRCNTKLMTFRFPPHSTIYCHLYSHDTLITSNILVFRCVNISSTYPCQVWITVLIRRITVLDVICIYSYKFEQIWKDGWTLWEFENDVYLIASWGTIGTLLFQNCWIIFIYLLISRIWEVLQRPPFLCEQIIHFFWFCCPTNLCN